ncbi:hypothetical protein [Acetobacter sp. P5B1]|uniref:immunity protein Imm33 domain-containing protein n=1 Tax=Acetobacter sp. P5B1 TaxID=2762620 RepID=UPI001C04E66E|nr:hypothetical protein [Acetobacter sp. P5B1]
MNIIKMQKKICEEYGSDFVSVFPNEKLGISINVKEKVRPLNGMRVMPGKDTCGWYIWAGEYLEDKDFFVPLHVNHLIKWEPLLLPYLGLAPGWRFLITEEYKDVWEDKENII